MSKQNISKKTEEARSLIESGRFPEAKFLYEQICQLDKKNAGAWMALGAIHGKLGNITDAVSCLRRATALQPNFPAAHFNLGNALQAQGKLPEALASFQQAVIIKPDYAEAYNALGSVLRSLGRLEEALSNYENALKHSPNSPQIHFNMGVTYLEQGKLDLSLISLRRTVRLNPNFAQGYCAIGQALIHKGLPGEAIVNYQQAIELAPAYADAHNGLGNAFRLMGRLDQAQEYIQNALRMNPKLAEAHYSLANVFSDLNKFNQAESHYRSALGIKHVYAEAALQLGNVLLTQGKVNEATTSYRQASNMKDGYTRAQSNYLLSLNYTSAQDQPYVFEEHKRWGETFANLNASAPTTTSEYDPDRILRVGYMSPDFRTHSVAYFIEPLLTHRGTNNIEIFCYAESEHADATTEKLKAIADNWRETQGKSDDQVAEMIRTDAIDILVDLAGHTSGNRLPVLARKPAPIQVTYLGYPNTTGLKTIDYRITDVLADPAGQEDMYTEDLIRLPHCFLCYQPPDNSPAVGPLPASTAGHVTYGSFNNLAKITPEVISTWANILRKTPGTNFILKNKPLQDDTIRERYYQLFADHGIDRNRIILLPWESSPESHLEIYNRVDIALDTFPYNGTTTTCEALWMGVPVISLAGTTHAGRVGASLLSSMGLTEFIAETEEHYVRLATMLAENQDKLEQLRIGLRKSMQDSQLCNGKFFTLTMENTYRGMWRRWCARNRA